MKLTKLTFFLILTLILSYIASAQGGICQFCGKWDNNLSPHELYCCEKNPNKLVPDKEEACQRCKKNLKKLKHCPHHCKKRKKTLSKKESLQKNKIFKQKKTQQSPLISSVVKTVKRKLVAEKNNNRNLNPPDENFFSVKSSEPLENNIALQNPIFFDNNLPPSSILPGHITQLPLPFFGEED